MIHVSANTNRMHSKQKGPLGSSNRLNICIERAKTPYRNNDRSSVVLSCRKDAAPELVETSMLHGRQMYRHSRSGRALIVFNSAIVYL